MFRRIKRGIIKTIKVARNYAIPTKDLSIALKSPISDSQKQKIDQAVKKTIKEYGDVLKKLGDE